MVDQTQEIEMPDETGLWPRAGSGHTAPVSGLNQVHAGRHAVERLLSLALSGRLPEGLMERVCGALESMVSSEPDRLGCIKWYWEEPHPVDTNASFFTARPMVTALLVADLRPSERAAVRSLLARLRPWLHLEAVEREKWYYPNKHLGDIATAWLIAEIDEDEAALDELREPMLATARDLGGNWGWGEHLSDVYGHLCIDLLALLLAGAKRLDPDLRAAYQELFNQVIAIDDAFADGPRVPTIRCYMTGTEAPKARKSYRARCADPSKSPFERANTLLGVSDLLPAAAPVQEQVHVACHDEVSAHACVRASCRLGGLTRWPMMADVDHPGWGLSWQTMPAALWHRAGWWAWPAWLAVEDGFEYGHPIRGGHKRGYLATALSRSAVPTPLGQTRCRLRGGNLVAHRWMPRGADTWESAGDVWCLVRPEAGSCQEQRGEGWSTVQLDTPDGPLVLGHIPLDGSEPAALAQAETGERWGTMQSAAQLDPSCPMRSLWFASLDGAPTAPPTISRDGEAWIIDWEWPGQTWRLKIDPTHPELLIRPFGAW
ncbi:MAG: hypothetical protein PF961_19855 [Planctomycetota bacterium]|jgi:hypothetical protein|nr:hypothetical protein [Planctomycetota bacterium]